ncbi:amino acid permease GAP1 Ecym_6021 [Eremothecium cymbalariae DBVPG|uniref:Amino acid permease/ SLC12A domain-containing protein n=1 Tax=Eremothecium cymbalariae (strain CBS 270.75 / DBVPG 7215 / KCTC 17166 / NRRL Y-17582) TaxID=931890 RepID=G8JUU8_ERECY|nr:hypothetical protein Ecym_6021 [Eremothecium cymbalariae DBVPG\
MQQDISKEGGPSVIDEKNKNYISNQENVVESGASQEDYSNSSYPKSGSKWKDFKDSFKRMDSVDLDPNLTDAQKIAILTSQSPLQRKLKNRHLQMIAIGGAIGTGLFIGSSKALRTAGPAGILIGWGLMATMILCMCLSLGEMAVTFPVSGGYTTYATRFIDESYGFANNINYMMQALVVLPLEIVAASITVDYWGPKSQYRAAFVALFWLCIVSINMFGVKGYGEAEFVFSLIKVVTVIGFIILGVILVCGGGPTHEYIGSKFWSNPGAFVGDTAGQKFKGICSVFVTAAFSFANTELVGLAAAETEDPRKSVPKAAKQVFWRITLFYILSLLMVGLLVPYTDPRLLGSSIVDAAASPFVLALKNHGIKGLPSVINVVILTAVLSVGNSSVFSCSRCLTALSEQGFLPNVFGYIDRKGRPLVSIIFSSAFGLLCFLAVSHQVQEIFDWMLSLSGLSSLFIWLTISLCHIRFRKALSAQNRSIDELAFASPIGIWGSYYSVFLIIVVLILQFWIALFPGHQKPSASNFFKAYLSMPIAVAMYLGHKIYTKNWKLLIDPKYMDIDTGRRELDIELFKQELLEQNAIMAKKPFIYRVYNFWC